MIDAIYSYKLAAIKLVAPGKEHLEKHCTNPTTKPSPTAETR